MKSKLPMIYQVESAECGVAALAMIMQFYGMGISLIQLRQEFPVGLSGTSISTLMLIAKTYDMQAKVLRIEPEDLANQSLPVILHWNLNHFVVLKEVRNKKFIIHDPAKGVIKLSQKQISQNFSGILFKCQPEKIESQDYSFNYFLLVKLLIFFGIYQVLILVFPRYFQLMIDKVIVFNNTTLACVLAGGYLWFKLLSILAKLGKEFCVLKFESDFSQIFATNIAKKLLSQPFDYFVKRYQSEILNRFNSVEHIRQILANGLFEGAWDGIVCVILLLAMIIMSHSLSFISASLMIILLIMRYLSQKQIDSANHELILTRCNEQAHLQETIRGIQPIKLFAKEKERLTQWKKYYQNYIFSLLRIKKLRTYHELSREVVISLDLIFIIFISSFKIIQHSMTLGNLYAYLFYRQMFFQSLFNFIEKMNELKLFHLHNARLKDICVRMVCKKTSFPIPDFSECTLRVTNLGFKYSPLDPFILKNINIDIKEGEMVVLVGASGSGKSTLLKIMMGLLQPTIGELQIKNLKIASVMQQDCLLKGNIAQNIAFSPTVNKEKVEHCAKLAGIYDEIITMPLKFDTLVGDMGAVLSGGQQQRILLARALYTDPQILFLDEATSHLDAEKEKEVNLALKSLGITCIMIAHREETIRMADRTILIKSC